MAVGSYGKYLWTCVRCSTASGTAAVFSLHVQLDCRPWRPPLSNTSVAGRVLDDKKTRIAQRRQETGAFET